MTNPRKSKGSAGGNLTFSPWDKKVKLLPADVTIIQEREIKGQ